MRLSYLVLLTTLHPRGELSFGFITAACIELGTSASQACALSITPWPLGRHCQHTTCCKIQRVFSLYEQLQKSVSRRFHPLRRRWDPRPQKRVFFWLKHFGRKPISRLRVVVTCGRWTTSKVAQVEKSQKNNETRRKRYFQNFFLLAFDFFFSFSRCAEFGEIGEDGFRCSLVLRLASLGPVRYLSHHQCEFWVLKCFPKEVVGSNPDWHWAFSLLSF